MEGKVRNRVFVYNAYHRDAQEIMIPNNEPPAIVVPPSGSFTTPAPPRGAAPWPTATQRLLELRLVSLLKLVRAQLPLAKVRLFRLAPALV